MNQLKCSGCIKFATRHTNGALFTIQKEVHTEKRRADRAANV